MSNPAAFRNPVKGPDISWLRIRQHDHVYAAMGLKTGDVVAGKCCPLFRISFLCTEYGGRKSHFGFCSISFFLYMLGGNPD